MTAKKILVADDDPAVIRMVSLELEGDGYQVISASSGKEALDLIYRQRPDLLILDYNMPDGDGVYVLTSLRTALETFTIPTIMLTAYESEDLRREAFALSARFLLSKPFQPGELAEKVKKALAG